LSPVFCTFPFPALPRTPSSSLHPSDYSSTYFAWKYLVGFLNRVQEIA